MSRRKTKGRITTPFVWISKDMLKSPAWIATSHGGRSLYIALKSHLSNDHSNNGHFFLSQRKAARQIGSDTEEITHWYRELQHYGFIVMTKGAYLDIDGVGKSPHWRLTEIDYKGKAATCDYIWWSGEKYSRRAVIQKQKPVPEKGDGVSRKRGTAVTRFAKKDGTTVPEKGDIRTELTVPEKGDISSKPLPSPSLTPPPTSKTYPAFSGWPNFRASAKSADCRSMSADPLCHACDGLVTPVTFPVRGMTG
jgi:hypothetical protein